MTAQGPDTDQLLDQIAQGDENACGTLLQRYRPRLRQMIALRLDHRLQARIDPSDVLQETFTEAAQKLAEYAHCRPLPFYPWLRRLAWERLVRLHRRHLQAARRSVRREQPLPLPDESAVELADRLSARGSSPSVRLQREETANQVRTALAQLRPRDQEVLVLRHLEHLSVQEIAAILELTEDAVKTRHLRALQRLRQLLGNPFPEDLP